MPRPDPDPLSREATHHGNSAAGPLPEALDIPLTISWGGPPIAAFTFDGTEFVVLIGDRMTNNPPPLPGAGAGAAPD
jgi:hypothetical protein